MGARRVVLGQRAIRGDQLEHLTRRTEGRADRRRRRGRRGRDRGGRRNAIFKGLERGPSPVLAVLRRFAPLQLSGPGRRTKPASQKLHHGRASKVWRESGEAATSPERDAVPAWVIVAGKSCTDPACRACQAHTSRRG